MKEIFEKQTKKGSAVLSAEPLVAVHVLTGLSKAEGKFKPTCKCIETSKDFLNSDGGYTLPLA
jgi:hypothetical protein